MEIFLNALNIMALLAMLVLGFALGLYAEKFLMFLKVRKSLKEIRIKMEQDKGNKIGSVVEKWMLDLQKRHESKDVCQQIPIKDLQHKTDNMVEDMFHEREQELE